MKLRTILAYLFNVFSIAAALRIYDELVQQVVHDRNDIRLISFSETEHKWLPDSAKAALIQEGIKFIDITDHYLFYEELALNSSMEVLKTPGQSPFPSSVSYHDEITKISEGISQTNMQKNIQKYTSFFTRYYKSKTGRDAAQWLAEQLIAISKPYEYIEVKLVDHEWLQQSVVVTINGTRSPETIIVVAAHLDSINGANFTDRSPGADDNASGTVTNLETFRTLIESGYKPENTLEFHWYSGEEGGLLGSQDIFTTYHKENVNVKAMLQQDMTGYVTATLESGNPENFGVVTDFVDPELVEFVQLIIAEYTALPYYTFPCGYACSDHASAYRVGYPSAFVIETGITSPEAANHHVHTSDDIWQYLNFYHMEQHARLALAFAYELGNHVF